MGPRRFVVGCLLVSAAIQAACTAGSGTVEQVVQAYKPDAGSYSARTAEILLPFEALDKQLPLLVTYPQRRLLPADDAGLFPVIIFSHGGRCWHDRYRGIAEHWASHGYVVMQPAHLDARSGPPPKIRGMQMMNEAVRTRRLDMVHILDSLATIESLVPEIAGQVARDRIVASGHSMGGGTVMSITGLTMVDPSKGTEFGLLDERIDALLLLTDPGNSPMMPAEPWRSIALPTFIATGTHDFSGLVRHIRKSKSVFRFPEDRVESETPNYYLFVTEMDHYLGGLICKPLDESTPDDDAARIIGGASIAFLDAVVREDRRAAAFLSGNYLADVEPRATMSVR